MNLIEGVSVIVCSLNRANIFRKLYKAISEDACVREFIFINDGSTESYTQIVDEMQKYFGKRGIHFIYLENETSRGAPFCRNRGLRHITSRYVFFVDDDMIFEERFLGILYEGIKKRKSQAVGPRIYYLTKAEYFKKNYIELDGKVGFTKQLINRKAIIGHFDKKISPEIISADFISAVILYDFDYLRKNSISFYEGYGGNAFREETDPQVQLTLAGGEICYCSDCVCFHLPHEILGKSGQRKKGIFWYEYWAIKNNYIFLKRFKEYFEKKYGRPLFMFQINFILSRIYFYFIRIPKKLRELFMRDQSNLRTGD